MHALPLLAASLLACSSAKEADKKTAAPAPPATPTFTARGPTKPIVLDKIGARLAVPEAATQSPVATGVRFVLADKSFFDVAKDSNTVTFEELRDWKRDDLVLASHVAAKTSNGWILYREIERASTKQLQQEIEVRVAGFSCGGYATTKAAGDEVMAACLSLAVATPDEIAAAKATAPATPDVANAEPPAPAKVEPSAPAKREPAKKAAPSSKPARPTKSAPSAPSAGTAASSDPF